MQVWTKGPFRICVDQGDDDPPSANEFEISLRFDPSEIAGTFRAVKTAEEGYEALAKIEETITQHVGRIAPELRDALRNQVALKIPGLAKALGWAVEKKS